jgi:hypothetical protein
VLFRSNLFQIISSNEQHCDTTNLLEPINLLELKYLTEQVNERKALGINQIGTNLINCSDITKNLTAYQISLFNMSNYLPVYFKTASISSLPKTTKAEKMDYATNYRPISLLPIIYKLYERHILYKLNTEHKLEERLHPLQGGFRRRRGTLEQLAMLNQISENAKTNNTQL